MGERAAGLHAGRVVGGRGVFGGGGPEAKGVEANESSTHPVAVQSRVCNCYSSIIYMHKEPAAQRSPGRGPVPCYPSHREVSVFIYLFACTRCMHNMYMYMCMCMCMCHERSSEGQYLWVVGPEGLVRSSAGRGRAGVGGLR